MRFGRIICFIVILALALLMFSGCSSQNEKETQSKAQSTAQSTGTTAAVETKAENITLSFIHSETEKPERALFFEQLAEKFTKLNPNIKIEITKVGFDDFMKAIQTGIASGSPYDISLSSVTEIKTWLEKAGLIDIGKYLDANNGEWRNWFADGLMDLVKYSDGKIYGAPVYIDAIPMNYHKEIFEKDGIQPPKNKTEFYALCDKFKAEGYTPFQLHGSMTDEFLTILSLQFMAKYNIQPFDVLNGKVPYTDSWFVDSLNLFKEIYEKGYLPKNFWTINGTEGRMAYSQGKMPMKMGYYWDVDTHYQMGMSYENQMVATMPNLTGDDSLKAYKMLSPFVGLIHGSCKNPDAAAEFLKFMTNKENQDDFAYKYFGKYPNGMPAANKEVKLSDYAKQYLDEASAGIPTSFSLEAVSVNFVDELGAKMPLFLQNKMTVQEIAADLDKAARGQ